MSIIPGAELLYANIRREIERTMRMLHKPSRLGLVSSYDKKMHAVKVRFQPEGTPSGWIPLTPLAAGNKFGILAAPNIKDQVEINHQEGDHMVGRVIQRHFSQKADVPPEVEAGEYHFIHGSGSVIRQLKDGSLQIAGASMVKTEDIGKGTSGNLSTQGENDQDDSGNQQQPERPAGKHSFTFKPDGSTELLVPDPNAKGDGDPKNPQHTATVKNNITYTSQQGDILHQAQKGNITNTADKDITHTAQGNINRAAQNNISDKAQNISHNGNTTVTGNLGVSQGISALSANFGTASLAIDSTGHFNGTSGGQVTGGFSADALTVTAGGHVTGGLAIDTITATGAISAASLTTTGMVSASSFSGAVNFNPPTTKTTNYTMIASDYSLIFNGSGAIALTLQAASSYSGRTLYLKTVAAFAVNSASSNVVPIGTTTAGTAILANTAGKWAILQSDGTNWITMAAN